jgi:hypothetical protein
MVIIELLNQGYQTTPCLVIPTARLLRDLSNLGHQVEHVLSFHGDDRITEHIAQHADILAQRLMWVWEAHSSN